MEVHFYEGWPLRYAHVTVPGLRAEHASHGTICLWAEDDPAQIAGRDLSALWARLDEWAATAQSGFGLEDRALDAYMMFENISGYMAELPFEDFLRRGTNGYRALLQARTQGIALLIDYQEETTETTDDEPLLKGAFYLRGSIGSPPQNLDEFREHLTRKQREDLERGISARAPTAVAEPSGGYDFVVLAWPRHDRQHDAIVLGFQNQGTNLNAFAMAASANDVQSRKRRAGPDAATLGDKNVLLAGLGSIGGHVAITLAASGIGKMTLADSDVLKSANVVRHVCSDYHVGYRKTVGVSIAIDHHAPWCETELRTDLTHKPATLAQQISGYDLVVDCTGTFSMTAALAEVCGKLRVPLVTVALYHHGSITRVRRQVEGDVLIAEREHNPAYVSLPPETLDSAQAGFLELGCTAPVNNAPPVAVLAAATEIAETALDFLTSRHDRPDELIQVIRPLDTDPYTRIGYITQPAPRNARAESR